MIEKTITYKDFNDEERTEVFHFNISQAEVIEMQNSADGGLSEIFKKIIASKDTKKIIEYFKDFVLKAYGEKSADGRRFIKSKELSDAFSQTNAYNDLFMELATDAGAAAKFVNGVMPPKETFKINQTQGM